MAPRPEILRFRYQQPRRDQSIENLANLVDLPNFHPNLVGNVVTDKFRLGAWLLRRISRLQRPRGQPSDLACASVQRPGQRFGRDDTPTVPAPGSTSTVKMLALLPLRRRYRR